MEKPGRSESALVRENLVLICATVVEHVKDVAQIKRDLRGYAQIQRNLSRSQTGEVPTILFFSSSFTTFGLNPFTSCGVKIPKTIAITRSPTSHWCAVPPCRLTVFEPRGAAWRA